MLAFYLLALVKIIHSMNQFEFSVYRADLVITVPHRVATHSFKRIEFVSHFIPFLPSRLFGHIFHGGGGRVSWPPARPGALRRDAARRVATRCGVACGKGSTREGRFPALRPKSRRSMGSPWRQTSPYLYSPRYFPMKPHGSAPCRPDCSPPFARFVG